MSGKKGMKHYSQEFKSTIIADYEKGMSVKSLSKKYQVSRRSVQRWCGLVQVDEQKLPKPKGRPKKGELSPEERIKELERENDLLRSFLAEVGRM